MKVRVWRASGRSRLARPGFRGFVAVATDRQFRGVGAGRSRRSAAKSAKKWLRAAHEVY